MTSECEWILDDEDMVSIQCSCIDVMHVDEERDCPSNNVAMRGEEASAVSTNVEVLKGERVSIDEV